MTQPTGVFVRLPLSEDQRELMVDAATLGQPGDSHDKAILAIGTPVTGWELEVVGYECDVQRQGYTHFSHDVVRKIGISGFGIEYKNIIPLIRQSDALAKLAEKDAEIARLWSALDEIEMGIDAIPDDNEDYSKMSAREMQRQALEVVKAEVKALKGAES